ncbi:YggT family protein [Saccharophagus degradans]|uniref:YggT family protein n=1 Tax=Saccharophagus degradans (strain 2-40 / ATCC 43961 / DSM 17024) TaxID=203122 RepID=Q21EI1_SACD2|nr:YggT family protein [Saccharophagus degradans]ABD82898.1 protein of unknown function YGGT [Saccharophagus degradans 2-40]
MATSVIQALVFIIETIASVFLLLVILRFILQMARADFYNPISQAIVKITSPVLKPLRVVIPGLFGIDIASIVLALLVQIAFGEIVSLIGTGNFINPVYLLIWGAIGLIMYVANILIIAILVLVITSFVAPYSTHPALTLVRQLMQPLLAPIQKIIPPAGGLDFSVMALGMIIYVAKILLGGVAVSAGVLPFYVIGF